MIKVVARKLLLAGKEAEAMELCRELVEATRKEKGCIVYEVYQDVNNPLIIAMIEEWEDQAVLQAHMQTEHFTRIVPMLNVLSAKETEVNVYNKVI